MASDPLTDVDFWEFVSCAKCHLPYTSEPGKVIPFWLTECGHIICNNHLNPDQSCVSCGATGILVVALQRELDAPMSNWFKSIPSALDSVIIAAKFQQEVMARQIRFYRNRHQQIRTVVEKLRSDNSALKSMNETLAQEIEQMKQQFGYSTFTTEGINAQNEVTNGNGKRPLEASAYQYGYPSTRPRTHSSSPQHLSTPTRLTLPAGHHAPGWAQPKDDSQRVVTLQPSQNPRANPQGISRPMSRQISEYAYIPPDTARPPGPLLTRTQQVSNVIHTSPTITKSQAQSAQPTSGTIRHTVRAQNAGSEGMGPPPVPQARLGTPAHFPASSRNHMLAGRRFVPAQSAETARLQPPTSHGPQRFFPRAGNSHQRTTQTWQLNIAPSSGAGYG